MKHKKYREKMSPRIKTARVTRAYAAAMRKIGLTILATFLFTTAVLSQNGGRLPKAQSELVEAEKNFARYCVENGQREAWLAFFADDGIMFQPGPVNAKEVMSKRPATPKPPPVTLNWHPIYGDISRAGDLGYNIGPWKITDQTEQKRPNLYGYFFSVWRSKQVVSGKCFWTSASASTLQQQIIRFKDLLCQPSDRKLSCSRAVTSFRRQ